MTALLSNLTATPVDTSDDVSVQALPSISGVALAMLADVGGFGDDITDGIVLTRSNGTKAPPTIARLPYTPAGLSALAGTPIQRDVDGSALLGEVRAKYKSIDPKARTMGKRPSGSALVKRLLALLAGAGIDHKDDVVSTYRANVWAIAAADPALDESAPEGTPSAPIVTDDGETVHVPYRLLEAAVDANAFSNALRFLTADNSLAEPAIKKRARLCVIPARATDEGVEYRLVKMIDLDDVAALLARIGWRTPGAGAAMVVIPTVDASVKKAIIADHGESAWERVYVANKAAVDALADVKMEAVSAILGGKPPVLTARAARAVETGAYYAETLRALGREDLIAASLTLGAINGLADENIASK